jgi:hypothetical protein
MLGGQNRYADWRLESGAVSVLCDADDNPPETLLQNVWYHQRVHRDKLVTLDKRRIRILHPGFKSREGGPDFRQAMMRFDDGPVLVGDVEIDVRPGGWRAHGHELNPAFDNVVLHVVWDSERAAAQSPGLPVLCLKPALDASLGELSVWLASEPGEFPPGLRGRCSALLAERGKGALENLLHEAAGVRLRCKGLQFSARAREAGWEQSLWEGLFRALGYKHNVWPMQYLGELRHRWWRKHSTRLEIEARLFGIGGLLPTEMSGLGASAKAYFRRVWDAWWRERESFLDCLLPREAWRLHGLRPANHPQRRLALASGWAAQGDLPARLERWCVSDFAERDMVESLEQALSTDHDEFWSFHWTLTSHPLQRRQPLLGPGRVTDVAMNIVLPWLWRRAVEGKNEAMRERLERRYYSWPGGEDNSVLRMARERLLEGADRKVLQTAAAQQGLLQVVRDFCDRSDAVCHGCRLPELLLPIVAQQAAR